MMKKMLLVILAAIAVLAGASPAGAQDTNCYTIVVGKAASADGSVIVAHNEDDSGAILVNLRKIKARDYGAPQTIDLGRGAKHVTGGRTAGFLWIEATTQEFADSFLNEYGVLLTSDSCPSRETKSDVTDGGIGYMLRRLVAEGATSAREAVTIAGALIEKYGYTGSGRTYTIADRNEAWMLAVIKGRHWCAERIPDDEVAVIPNHYTIRVVDLADATRFLGSRDIADYAKANGWYDETKDGKLDFKKAFDRTGRADLVSDGNTLRHWRGLSLLSDKKWEISNTYPFSFKAAKKVTPESLMALLRDHYEGTEYDATEGYKTGTPNKTKFRTICTATTIDSFVASLKAGAPDPLADSLWIALGKPDTTLYLPLYYGVASLPPSAGVGPDDHDYARLYKQHFEDAELKSQKERLFHTKVLALQNAAEADYAKMRGEIDRELGPLEHELVANRAKIESEIATLYAKDKGEAVRRLTAYVADAFGKAAALYDRLLQK